MAPRTAHHTRLVRQLLPVVLLAVLAGGCRARPAVGVATDPARGPVGLVVPGAGERADHRPQATTSAITAPARPADLPVLD
jgi:hypothetical protein